MFILERLNVDTLLQQVLIVLQWVIGWVEVLIRRSVSLLERGVLDTLVQISLHLVAEVPLGEQTVGWYPMVVLCGLIVPQVLEAGGMRVRKVEWHVCESIVDRIALFSLEELLQIVLHDWALSVGGMLGSCDLSLDAISKGENVLKSLVLESVWVHIDES